MNQVQQNYLKASQNLDTAYSAFNAYMEPIWSANGQYTDEMFDIEEAKREDLNIESLIAAKTEARNALLKWMYEIAIKKAGKFFSPEQVEEIKRGAEVMQTRRAMPNALRECVALALRIED